MAMKINQAEHGILGFSSPLIKSLHRRRRDLSLLSFTKDRLDVQLVNNLAY